MSRILKRVYWLQVLGFHEINKYILVGEVLEGKFFAIIFIKEKLKDSYVKI